MCGITGYLSTNERANNDSIRAMCAAIKHRGPDGDGVWLENNVALGHTRLAIQDLSESASQPMVSVEHRYVLSYNGEIYNFKELRNELEKLGYWFRSTSDTEVVLYALIEWKEKALLKFNGMFALALWDRKQQELLLARDRYGIKPLYYALQSTHFYFGSEQKAISSNSQYKSELDKDALVEYFTFQNIFTDRTFEKDIKLLEPGTWLKVTLQNKSIVTQKSQYWDYNFKASKQDMSENEYSEQLEFLMQQAVERQLVSDVEVGAYLSGGIDSGAITAFAAKQLPYIKSFTCGFDLSSAAGIELGFDERRKAEAMSALYKTEHYQMVLKAGDMERCLPRFAYHLEEPRIGQSYPNYYASQLASKFVKVCLSGIGGDELFAGYPWRYYGANNSQNFDQFIDNYYLFWQRLIPNSELKQVFAPIWEDVDHVWTKDIFRGVFKKQDLDPNNTEDLVNHCLYFEAKTFLHGLLVVEDKLSMSHGLETRVPFLDNDLVDFAMRCPVKYKLSQLGKTFKVNENNLREKNKSSVTRTSEGKQILRKVMKPHLPDNVSSAAKQGFSSPDASWFKGSSMEFVKEALFDQNAPIYSLLEYNSIHKLIDSHLKGEKNRRLLIWSLLNFNQYLVNQSA